MTDGTRVIQPVLGFSEREDDREHRFKQVWTEELNKVFDDVAGYYDRANRVAGLGFWDSIQGRFFSTIEVKSGQKVLDVCAGTNAVGIALLRKQPDLRVSAIDRSPAMQEVGRQRAARLGLRIESTIGDAHRLPFPDNHFDVVTLQWASRHLRIMDVSAEVLRVLKPGGHFYHCDLLRPGSRLVERVYHAYLRATLSLTATMFQCGQAARDCKEYFIEALRLFYSVDELTQLFRHQGYENVTSRSLLGGTIGFHRARKP
ncbi:MAG TPA: class I SAM-dependent methyltransferase [Acidiferrobacterales bacterium]|jgi:demethylmenaquinone methyltransferase/2-methoxy-6-polyprenyl-1,4-benzoquinol methylase